MPTDYQRIEQALNYLSAQHGNVTLDTLAKQLQLSPGHFQRLFSRWVGISPKRFSQLLNVERAKQLLTEPQPLLSLGEQLQLSSSSRLYDHFVRIEAMSPGEYRSQGQALTIRWGCATSHFGPLFLAQTQRGICSLAFGNGESELAAMTQRWPAAIFREDHSATEEKLQNFFKPGCVPQSLSLHVLASDFQLQVWRALLSIPSGQLSSYSALSRKLGRPQAARAVGRAVGGNPVALLIPCHRVIRQNGELGGYRWGVTRKRAILVNELGRQFSD